MTKKDKRIRITDGVTSKLVTKSEVESLIPLGWSIVKRNIRIKINN